MTGWWWALAGAGTAWLLGLAVVASLERDIRTAIGQILTAALIGLPLAVFALADRAGAPRVRRLSNAALARWADAQRGDGSPHWVLLGPGKSRGVLFIRRNPAAPLPPRAREDRRR